MPNFAVLLQLKQKYTFRKSDNGVIKPSGLITCAPLTFNPEVKP